MEDAAGQAWFVAGTLPLVVAGLAHALGALRDAVRPTFFTPVDEGVRPALDATTIRLRRMVPGGDQDRPSMWRAWLGFNISHGLGVAAFGLVCLLIGLDDFAAVERIALLQPLTIAVAAAYLALALRFWFYGPVLLTGTATACFTVAAVV